mmetsp:Transcript_110125/g.355451  ORF Transcript_110125/g.355451 Transcript_110125/m.355451 type:complete len:294 (-) Transcript_110125:83-964(-)
MCTSKTWKDSKESMQQRWKTCEQESNSTRELPRPRSSQSWKQIGQSTASPRSRAARRARAQTSASAMPAPGATGVATAAGPEGVLAPDPAPWPWRCSRACKPSRSCDADLATLSSSSSRKRSSASSRTSHTRWSLLPATPSARPQNLRCSAGASALTFGCLRCWKTSARLRWPRQARWMRLAHLRRQTMKPPKCGVTSQEAQRQSGQRRSPANCSKLRMHSLWNTWLQLRMTCGRSRKSSRQMLQHESLSSRASDAHFTASHWLAVSGFEGSATRPSFWASDNEALCLFSFSS